jgi:hypothetical protein
MLGALSAYPPLRYVIFDAFLMAHCDPQHLTTRFQLLALFLIVPSPVASCLWKARQVPKRLHLQQELV